MNDICEKYKPPFPWFGGKSRVAQIVWNLLGDVDHYIEPFFGSGAVLFMRPKSHKKKLETVNDKDVLLSNFWRAVKHDPDGVAEYASDPVNEADLTARHIWLVKYGLPELSLKIQGNPDYYDVKIAGWWVWGVAQWLGSGWCSGKGCWTEENGLLVRIEKDDGNKHVTKKIPAITDGQGIHRIGIYKVRPHITYESVEVLDAEIDIYSYMRNLANRLRHVRIVCGDWTRVVKNSVLSRSGVKGVFLDPPYGVDFRDTGLYNEDNIESISKNVNKWCVDHSDKDDLRIVLCGYEGEHNNLEELGWKKIAWKNRRAYGTSKGKTKNAENRFFERIWYNKNCLDIEGDREWKLQLV